MNLRVFSVMGVFFFVGLGLWLYPGDARKRWMKLSVGLAIMAFALWFAISIVLTTHAQAFYLQPAVQAVIVAVIGVLIYRFRSGSHRQVPAAVNPEP